MRYVKLDITPEDKDIKERRDRAKILMIDLQQANASGDKEKVAELTSEVQALNVQMGFVCGDSEILRVLMDRFAIETRADNRFYCRIYEAAEKVEEGYLELSDEQYAWLLAKSDKLNLAEKYKDDKGNMQDLYHPLMKRGIGKIQDKIEQALTELPK